MGSDTIQTLLYESRIEIKRLRARLLSEQKQRLDQFDFVKTYDAAKCKVEIDELKAINAELLAALEKFMPFHNSEYVPNTLFAHARAAIEKAKQ